MIPEIGQYLLILSFCAAVLQSLLSLLGASRRQPVFMQAGGMMALVQLPLIGASFAVLIYSFIISDFSVAVVAMNSHSTQPLLYRFAGSWGNHEGSMLLWVFTLAVFGAAVSFFGRDLPPTLKARVLGIQGLIGTAFLAFILFTSNPFARLVPAPIDGAELNPLLQDPGLAFHPPMLYFGYVGFSVAFAFSVAALLEGHVDAAWARWVRPWVLAAWICLTIGIAAGSYWAYYELGWGGWWYWDPVENASFMPWLLGTALLHSALVVERRQALVSWTILLGILTFSLSLVGTFLVRSGVLTSVHAFAVDPERGVFILAIIVVSTGGALLLYALKAHKLVSPTMFAMVSRETSLIGNNLLLLGATAVVFIGTFFPIVAELISDDKISVGPPYYVMTFVPVALLLLPMMMIGPMLRWKRDSLLALWQKARWLLLAVGTIVVLCFIFVPPKALMSSVGVGFGLGLMGASLFLLWRRLRSSGGVAFRRFRLIPSAVWALALAHFGLGVSVVGISAISGWQSEHIVAMAAGDVANIGRYDVTLRKVETIREANYEAERATFDIKKQGVLLDTMASEQRFYPVRETMTTESAIETMWHGNLYIAMGGAVPGNRWSIRLNFHPFVVWIWGGGLIMAFGGMVSLCDRRFRIGMPQRKASPQLAPAAA